MVGGFAIPDRPKWEVGRSNCSLMSKNLWAHQAGVKQQLDSDRGQECGCDCELTLPEEMFILTPALPLLYTRIKLLSPWKDSGDKGEGSTDVNHTK
jgi:hypothetical protein